MRWLTILIMCLLVGCSGGKSPAPPVDPPVFAPPHIVSVSPNTLTDGILGLVGTDVVLSAEVTGDGPFTWDWVFDDGVALDDAQSPTPLATLQTPGSFTGKLTVEGPGGTDTEELEISIDTAIPFVASVTQAPGRPTFRQRAKLTATVFGQLPRTFEWHFDPRVRIVQNNFRIVEVQADSPGIYGGFLIVRNALGASELVEFTVEIFDALPVNWTRRKIASRSASDALPARPTAVLHEDAVVVLTDSSVAGVQCFMTPIAGLEAAPVWTSHTIHPDRVLTRAEERMVNLEGRLYVVMRPDTEVGFPEIAFSEPGLPSSAESWTLRTIQGVTAAEDELSAVSIAVHDQTLLVGYTEGTGFGKCHIRLQQVQQAPGPGFDQFQRCEPDTVDSYEFSEVRLLEHEGMFFLGYQQTTCQGSAGCLTLDRWFRTTARGTLGTDDWEQVSFGPARAYPSAARSIYLPIQGNMGVVMWGFFNGFDKPPVIDALLPIPAAVLQLTPIEANPTRSFDAAVLDDRVAVAYHDDDDKSLWIARERSAEQGSESWSYAVPIMDGHVAGPLDVIAVNDRLVVVFSDPVDNELAMVISDSSY